jgi:hypothetical protein
LQPEAEEDVLAAKKIKFANKKPAIVKMLKKQTSIFGSK